MPVHLQDPSNLFDQLYSYSPREGRSALEDYCTESLAWLLAQSSGRFRNAFLESEDEDSFTCWRESKPVSGLIFAQELDKTFSESPNKIFEWFQTFVPKAANVENTY